jgi:Leucine-rich repeat (LRR) protein
MRTSSTPSPQVRSFWRRFIPRISLRTLFVLLTLFCIFLGALEFYRQRAIREHAACDQLREAGWWVEFAGSHDDEKQWSSWFRALPARCRDGYAFHLWFSVKKISPPPNPDVLTGCRIAAQLRQLDELEFLSDTDLNSQVCDAVARIPNLKTLKAPNAFIDDTGAAQLATMRSLESLDLSNTKIGNEGARQLAKLLRLKSLFLAETNIDDQALAALSKLKYLESLNLFRTKITSTGFANLASLQRLKTLNIEGTEVDDQIASTIAQLSNLEELNLNDCALTDASCAKMLRQPSLTIVKLEHAEIGAETLQALAALPNLNELELKGVVLKPGDLKILLAAKNLTNLRAPDDTTFGDLLAFHQHSALNNIKSGYYEYSVEDLKLLAGAPTTEKSLLIGNLPLGDEDWRHLASSKSLESLHIDRSGLTDHSLKRLASLQSLTQLTIEGCPITDSGLAEIGNLTNLEELEVKGAPITDEGLKHLAKLSKLRKLHLEDCDKLTEAGLAIISPLQDLESVVADAAAPIDPPLPVSVLFPITSQRSKSSLEQLSWGTIQFEGAELDLLLNRPIHQGYGQLSIGPEWILSARQLQLLAEQTDCSYVDISGPAILEDQFALIGPTPVEYLTLDHVQLGPKAVRWLASLPALGYLHFYQMELTEDAANILSTSSSIESLYMTNTSLAPHTLRSLAELPKLKSIELNECQFHEADLLHLARAKQLESLTVSHCLIKLQTLAKLLRALPALETLELSHCGLGKDALNVLTENGKRITNLGLNHNQLKLEDIRPHILAFPKLTSLKLAPETSEWSWFDSHFDESRLQWIRWDALRKRGQDTPRPKAEPYPISYGYGHRFGPPPLQVGNPWIDDELAIEMLRTNPKFSTLGASYGAVGLPLLTELAKTDHVRDLNLSYTRITDDDLTALAKLTRLRILDLSGCNITDRGVEILAQVCPRLEVIELAHTKVTAKHFAKFRFLRGITLKETNLNDEGRSEIHSLKHVDFFFDTDTFENR